MNSLYGWVLGVGAAPGGSGLPEFPGAGAAAGEGSFEGPLGFGAMSLAPGFSESTRSGPGRGWGALSFL